MFTERALQIILRIIIEDVKRNELIILFTYYSSLSLAVIANIYTATPLWRTPPYGEHLPIENTSLYLAVPNYEVMSYSLHWSIPSARTGLIGHSSPTFSLTSKVWSLTAEHVIRDCSSDVDTSHDYHNTYTCRSWFVRSTSHLFYAEILLIWAILHSTTAAYPMLPIAVTFIWQAA